MIIESSLPYLSQQQISDYFKKYGKVVRITRGRRSTFSVDNRYLFLKFDDYLSVEKVIGKLHRINNKNIAVHLAKDW